MTFVIYARQDHYFEWNAEKGKTYIIKYEEGKGHNNQTVINLKRVWLEDAITGEFIQEITEWSTVRASTYTGAPLIIGI